MKSFRKFLALLMVIFVFTGSSAPVEAAAEQTVYNVQELQTALALPDEICSKVILAGTDFLINEDIMVFKDIELLCPVTVDGKNNVMLFGRNIVNKSTLTNNGSITVFVGTMTNEAEGTLINNGNLQRVDDIEDDGGEGSLNRCAAIPEPAAESTGYVGIVADCATTEGLMYAMSSPVYNEIWVSQINDSGPNREIGIDLTVDGDLTVTRPTYIFGNDSLTVNGDLTIAPSNETEYGYIYLEGSAEVQGNLINYGDMLVAGGLTVAGKLSNYGHYTTAETGSLNVTGAMEDLDKGTHANEYIAADQTEWDDTLLDPFCSSVRIAADSSINITADTITSCNLIIDGELTIADGAVLTVNPRFDDAFYAQRNFVSGFLNNNGTLILNAPLEVGNQLNNSNKIVINRDAGIALSYAEDNTGNISTYASFTNTGEIVNHGFIDRWAPDEISEYIVINNTGSIWGDGYCYFDYAHLVTHWLDNYGSGWFEHSENYYDNQIGVTPGEHRVIFYLYHYDDVLLDWVYSPVTLTYDKLTAIPVDEISTDESQDTTNAAHFATLNITEWNSFILEYTEGEITYKFPVYVGLPDMGFYSSPVADTANYISQFQYTPDSRKFYAIASVPEGFSIVGTECNEDVFTVTQDGNVFGLELPAGMGGEYNLNFKVFLQADEDSNVSYSIDNWIWVHEGEYEGLVVNWPDWRDGSAGGENFNYPIIGRDWMTGNVNHDSRLNSSIGGSVVSIMHKYYDEAAGEWVYDNVDPANLIPSEDSGITIRQWTPPEIAGTIDDPDYANYIFSEVNYSKFGEFNIDYSVGESTFTLPVSITLPQVGFYSQAEASEQNYINEFAFTPVTQENPSARTFYFIANFDSTEFSVGPALVEDGAEFVDVTQSAEDSRLFTVVVKDGVKGGFRLRISVPITHISSGSSWNTSNEMKVYEGEYEGLVFNWTDWKDGSNGDYNYRYPILGRDFENEIRYETGADVNVGGATWAVFYRFNTDSANNSGTWIYSPVDPSLLSPVGNSGISISEWNDQNSGTITDSEYTDYKFTQLEFTKCGSFTINYSAGGKTYSLPVNVTLPGIAAYSTPNASEATLLDAVDFSARNVFYLVPTINMADVDISQTEFLINGSEPVDGLLSIQETGEAGFEYWTAQIDAKPFANDFNLRVVIRNADREEITSRDIWFYSQVDDAAGCFNGGTLETPVGETDTSMQIDALEQNYAGYFSFTPGNLTDQVYLFRLAGTGEGSIMYIFDENWNLVETGYWQDLRQSDAYLSSNSFIAGNTYYIAFINKGGSAAGFTLSASIENIPQQPDSIVWTTDERGMSGLLISGDVGQKCVIYVKIDGRWHERAGLRDFDPNSGTCFVPAAEILDNGESASEFAAAISENNIKSDLKQLAPDALTSVTRIDPQNSEAGFAVKYYPDNREAVITISDSTFAAGKLYRLQHKTAEGWWDFTVEFIGDGTGTGNGCGWGEIAPDGNFVLTEYNESEARESYTVGWRILADTERNIGSVQFNEITSWLAGGLQSPTQDSPGMRRFYQPLKYGRTNFWMVNYNTETNSYTFGDILDITDLTYSAGMSLSEEEGQLALEFADWGDYSISYVDELSQEHFVIINVRMNDIDFYSGTAPTAANVFPGSIPSINRTFYLIWSQNAEKYNDVDSIEYEVYKFFGKIPSGDSVEGKYYRDENLRKYVPASGVSDGNLDYFTREDATVSVDLTNIADNIAEFNLEAAVDNDLDIIAYLKSGDDVIGTIDKRINVFGDMWQSNFRSLSIWVMYEYTGYMFGVADSADATEMDAISPITIDESDGQLRGTFTGLTCDTTYYLYFSTDYNKATGEGTWIPASGISEMTSGHNFSPEWVKDETSHWHACECGGEAEKAGHTWNAGVVTTPATCEAAGVKTYTCTVCGGTKTEAIAALEHVWGDWTSVDASTHQRVCSHDGNHIESQAHTWDAGVLNTAATCEAAGVKTYTCTVCGGTKTEAIAALGHDWGSWTSADLDTHQRVCSHDGSHIQTAAHTWGAPVVAAPTCDAQGYTTHTCTVCGCFYTDTPVAALGHDWGSWTSVNATTHKRVCSHDASHIETDIHWMDTSIIEPTCTEAGYTIHFCTENCGYSYNDTYTEAHGHSYSNVWTSDNELTHSRMCQYENCSNTETANHTFISQEIVPATPTEAGLMQHTCTVCNYTFTTPFGPIGQWSPWTMKNDTSHCRFNLQDPSQTEEAAHIWGVPIVTDPTCTTAGYTTHTCTVCYYSYTDTPTAALGHDWGSWTSIDDDAVHQRVCSRDGNHIETQAHTWDEGIVTTPATCTEAGVMTYTCSVCGDTKTEAIAALGHNWWSWTSVDAATHQRVCSRDASHIQTEAHTWDAGVVTTPATCETAGVRTYNCSVCGGTKTESIVALGHDFGSWTSVDVSTHQRVCTHDGSHIETEAHTWNAGVVTTPATCEVAGVKTYTCSVCGGTKTEAIAATGHNYGEWQYLDETNHKHICQNDQTHTETLEHTWNAGVVTTQATCTEAGVKNYTCSVCGGTKTESIAALGHNWGAWQCVDGTNHKHICQNDPTHTETSAHTWDAGVVIAQATCTAAGVKTYTCSVCEGTLSEAIAPIGHNYGAWQYFDETNHIHICQNDQTHTETAAHTWDAGVVTAPTCTVAGYTTYTCTVCGGTKVAEPVAAIGHNYGAWQYFDETNHKHVCLNDQTHTETQEHTWNAGVVTTPATCEVAGVKTYTCSVCGGNKTEAIAATGHNYGEWQYLDETNHEHICQNDQTHTETAAHTWDAGVVTTPATCEAAGVRTYTCSVCGGTKTESIAALGHDFGSWTSINATTHQRVCSHDGSHIETEAHTLGTPAITAPTCTAAGYTTHTCTVCGYNYTDTPVAELGHQWSSWTSNNAATHQRVCSRDASHVETVAHTWGTPAVTAPTCTAAGYTRHTCTVCGYSYTNSPTAALGHRYTSSLVKAPTCTESGVMASVCTVDGDSYTQVIPPLGHNWGEWVVKVEATLTSDGIRERTCLNDSSHKETEVIPKLVKPSIDILPSGGGNGINAGVTILGSTALLNVDPEDIEKLEQASSDGGTITFDTSGLGTEINNLTLSSSILNTISGSGTNPDAGQADTGVRVVLSTAEVEFDAGALQSLVQDAEEQENITIGADVIENSTLTTEQQRVVGDAPVYDLTAIATNSNGQTRNISNFNGTVTIRIPYAPKEGEDTNAIRIYYLNDAGVIESIACSYDPIGRCIVFTTNHFSYYFVMNDEVGKFKDVSLLDWFYGNVQYVLANDLMGGTSESSFKPHMATSRAMLVTVLYRLEGSPAVEGYNEFSDVADGQWYTNAVIWAANNGIVGGYGNGKFGPNDNLTREQMVTILWRYAKYKGYDVSTDENIVLSGYSDSGSTSAYAAEAMRWGIGKGIINGVGNNSLAPKGNAERCQLAAILQRFMDNLVKK